MFLDKNNTYFYSLICFLSGIGFGGDLILSYSILTDIIQKDKLEQNQTTIFSMVNFIIKISLTISSAIFIYIVGKYINEIGILKIIIPIAYVIIPVLLKIFVGLFLYKNKKALI